RQIPGLEDVTIEKINYLNGIRVFFSNGEVLHLRPSGNSAQFRIYALAATMSRVDALVEEGTRPDTGILVRIIQDFVKSPEAAEERGVPAARKASVGRWAVSPVDPELEPYRGVIAEMNRTIENGGPVEFYPVFKRGKDGYTWGKPVRLNNILEVMGASTEAEKIELAKKYGIAGDEVIGEKWVAAGFVLTTDRHILLSPEEMALWAREFYGEEHLGRVGTELGLTVKSLDSEVPLSIQIHDFDEWITANADGWAIMGLNQDVGPEEFMDAMVRGDMSIFNRINLKKGESYLVPAGMPHAYGVVFVSEAKAVNAKQDAEGTISFYDRLKWDTYDHEKRTDAERLLRLALEGDTEALDEMDKKGYVRVKRKKDVIALSTDERSAIAARIQAYGFLKQVNPEDYRTMPVLASDPATQDKARYEKMVENPGFVVGRYSIQKGESIAVHPDIQGRPHSLVVEEGSVRINIVSRTGETSQFDLRPDTDRDMIIPANAESYTIEALEGKPAVVRAHYVPVSPETKVDVLLETGQTIKGIKELMEEEVDTYTYTAHGTLRENVMTETVRINTEASLPEILDGRTCFIAIQSGQLAVEINGEEIGVFDKQNTLKVGSDTIVDKLGTLAFTFPEQSAVRLIKRGAGSAVAEVRYEKTAEEDATYNAYRAFVRNISALQGKKIDLVVNDALYRSGDRSVEGSLAWYRNDWKKRGLDVRITAYSAVRGLEGAAAKNIREGATAVLIATDSDIKEAEKEKDPRVVSFLKGEKGNLRVLTIKDIKGLGEQGWRFVRETQALALLQAGLTADSIRTGESIVMDTKELMEQMTGKNIPREYLYSMLSYTEVGALEEAPAGYSENIFEWLAFIVKNLLVDMPIEPFDPQAQLEQRRKIMWSV
ncbi:MAG: hypothetical protein KAS86_00825, partial [Candidatus Omnitrophica bacterium]|nr:hypothetical protein [Candidatus Omnitrophota bacterium]